MTTHIEWTDETWNAITGCTKVSEGCEHCYIERTPPFRMAGRRFSLPGIGGTTDLKLHPERLVKPLSWRKPRRVFVNSLADLFHHGVPDEYIARVFAVMGMAPRHTFQVLTKRHARMRSLLASSAFRVAVLDAAHLIANGEIGTLRVTSADAADYRRRESAALNGHADSALPWPLANVWAGVSVENQEWADIRIPALLDTPAAVRWLSCEPLLGPVNLIGQGGDMVGAGIYALPDPTEHDGGEPACQNHGMERCHQGCRFVDWTVVGGESGPGARAMNLDWARSLVQQCQAARVPVFVKQLGAVWASDATWNGSPVSHEDKKGGEPGYWPTDLQVREYPAEVGS